MAIMAREILNANAMFLDIACPGMSFVGVKLAGTWAGTVQFFGAQSDFGVTGAGVGQPKPVSVYSFPSQTAQVLDGVTANGNFYWPVQNYGVFRAKFTRTSGSVQVTLAASIDGSWADAFLDISGRFRNSTAVGLNRMTIAADDNVGNKLLKLVVSAAGQSLVASSSSGGPSTAVWSQNPVIRINDSTTRLLGIDRTTTLPWDYDVPLPAIGSGYEYMATLGNPLVIEVAGGGAAVVTNINAVVGRG